MSIRTKFYLTNILLLLVLSSCSQTDTTKIDTLEFQSGYPTLKLDALEQLKKYASPRYMPNNNFMMLYNWMSPYYAGGAGQPGIKITDAIKKGTDIQEELAINWNYNLVISNPRIGPNEAVLKDPNSALSTFIELANKHPELPLSITVFWLQMSPSAFGYQNKKPKILERNLPESFYLKDARINKTVRVISYAAPDSIFIADGIVQRKQLQLLIKHLTRPINIINENGEEPPKAYTEGILKNDSLLIYDKNNLKIDSWPIYIATKKRHIRQLYSSQFMDSIPQLKNTLFTLYQVEGGPIDRFDWHTSKATCSKINGNYYSTPDFYPRVPNNWKTWKGPWHGWKWINDGRKVEIKDGDRWFSPFIAAGWSSNPEADIRPAQWLGLLKCLTVVGADFFYTGYFNESKPFSKPENYIWQAAMPAFAQAITTHYSDVFFHGNVLFDKNNNPIVTYPVNDKDVLVAVRKHDKKNKYVIAATVQPNSNTERFPLQKNVEITIDAETILLKARRQGSIYVYDKSVTPPIFYQLDRWHQYEHPSRWRKELIYEAEVFDTSSIQNIIKSDYIKTENRFDFTNSESWITLPINQWSSYTIYKKDIERLADKIYIMLYLKSEKAIQGNLVINDKKIEFKNEKSTQFRWKIISISKNDLLKNNYSILKLESLTPNLEIDKFIITDNENIPDLSDY